MANRHPLKRHVRLDRESTENGHFHRNYFALAGRDGDEKAVLAPSTCVRPRLFFEGITTPWRTEMGMKKARYPEDGWGTEVDGSLVREACIGT